ncbi:hypothetical protein DPEC_G00043190 [Dallia pectoralis]|uniref:Uncharacterized protein n=1 Tax=Dallia pectoralis TaxID=75939 RepID=A0ACC2H924_DALPE|nr:hypothetical protein DPEC_G00043190 [Dallia pectoralis]
MSAQSLEVKERWWRAGVRLRYPGPQRRFLDLSLHVQVLRIERPQPVPRPEPVQPGPSTEFLPPPSLQWLAEGFQQPLPVGWDDEQMLQEGSREGS